MEEHSEINSSSTLSIKDEVGDNDFFIDDYSHLRLSYYQCRKDTSDLTFFDSDNSRFSNKDNGDSENETIIQNESLQVSKDRQEIRKFYVSQIPELPHPSHTVASMIASMSHSMDSGWHKFKYNSSIEQGNNIGSDENTNFNPERRSTLNHQNEKDLSDLHKDIL